MAKTEWTVFWGQRDAGNQRPLIGWKEKELKVKEPEGTTTLEKNEPAPLAAFGTFKTAEVQQCYFATVIAESEKEACAVVDRALGLGNVATVPAATLETPGAGGPVLKGAFVSASGKYTAATSANLKEVTVL